MRIPLIGLRTGGGGGVKMEIMDTYLEQLYIHEAYYGKEFMKEVIPCNRRCDKLLKLSTKTATGFLLGTLPGMLYVQYMSKSGKLGILCHQRCAISALKKVITKTTDPEKKKKYNELLDKNMQGLKDKDEKVKVLMRKLEEKGKKKALAFVKKNYDIINGIR